MPRAGARISTPRPRPAKESTLLGGLARTLGSELEERRVLSQEAEDRKRQQELEDLQRESLQQGIGINRATALRNIFGMEEVAGPRRPPPAAPLEPQRIGTTGGTGVGLQLGAVPEDRPRGGVGVPIPETPKLEPGVPMPGLPGPTQMRRLEPARDPTIEHPELLPQAAEEQFDFTRFEQKFQLPEGSLSQAFETNPVGALNIVVDKARAAGGVDTATLNSLRAVVQTRINAVSDQLEFDILEPGEEQQLRDEIDELTIGLLDAATGFDRQFDLDDVLDELERIFPNDTDEQLAARAGRIQAVQRGAAEFAGRSGVRQLEPGR